MQAGRRPPEQAPDRGFRDERRAREHGREIRDVRHRQAMDQELGRHRRAGTGTTADDEDRALLRRRPPVPCALELRKQQVERQQHRTQRGRAQGKKRGRIP